MSQWQITIESNFSAIRKVSDLLSRYCAEHHISHEINGQLELMMVEALNNVIEHAYTGKDGYKILVEFSDNPKHTTIHIKDSGVAAANLLSQDIKLPEEDCLPEGGWGLPLIQALADTIHYASNNKNNVLTLTKNKI